MDSIFNYDFFLNLTTLSGLEIILGVDNVIFIALLIQNLPRRKRNHTRLMGLSVALLLRIGMLFAANWLIKMTHPLFHIGSFAVSGKTILLIIGGLFLIFKALADIIELFKDKENNQQLDRFNHNSSYFKIVSQIVFIDIILSFDSIIAAIALTTNLTIIIAAVVIAMIVMLFASNSVGEFISQNPSIKVVALAFIGFLGVFLFLAGLNIQIPKGYLYFSMFFAMVVELVNIKLEKK